MAQILFLLISSISIYFALKNFLKIRRNINLGTPERISGDVVQRWKNVGLVALGQKKMFKNWIPAILHLFIYTAFLVTQIELLEIFTDGAFGTHRFFAHYLGGFYTFIVSTIEILSVLAFVATIANVRGVSTSPRPSYQTFIETIIRVVLSRFAGNDVSCC